MQLGQFGSLTYNNKSTYNYSISKDFGMDLLLKKLGKANFSNPIVENKNVEQPALENLADEGHVEVLS